jgi:predicted RNase H-like HicB family nuclease
MPTAADIILEFDEETREYFAVWEPVIFGMGKTEQEAMQDMVAAAELLIDTNKKIDEIKED